MNAIDTMFEWLLAATLRASVLTVAILGIQLLLRRWLPAAWRHALWLPMLAVLVLPVLPSVPFGLFSLAEKSPIVAPVVADVAIVDDGMAQGRVAMAKPKAAITKLNYLAFVWLAGACGVFTVGMVGYRRNMIRVKKVSSSPDAALTCTIADAARDAGLGRVPRILISPAVESPAVTGLLRPVLLLPAGFPEGFSATETRLILLHEFSHLKRLDLPLNWLSCVLQAMHWFNPLLWFAFARMRSDREAACDARVLSIDSEDRRADYGGALLKLQMMAPSRGMSLGFVGIFERGSEMKSRIREISAHRPGHFIWQVAGGTIVTLLMIFGATKAQEAMANEGVAEKVAAAVAPAEVSEGAAYIVNKLRTLVISEISFENSSIEEAVDFLRLRSKELDVAEQDAAKKGINFVIRMSRKDGKIPAPFDRISVNMKNVTLEKAITSVAEQAGARCKVDDFCVTFISKNDVAGLHGADGEPAVEAAVQPQKLEGKAVDAANKIVIPMVNFEDTTLELAVEFLNLRAKELSKREPAFKLVIDPKVDAKVKIRELRLRNVPLTIAAKYCADQAKLRLVADDKEIRIMGWK